MAKYFMLECFPPDEWEDCALFQRAPRLPGVEAWTTGQRFSQLLPEPIEFLLLDTHNDQLRELHNVDALVITKRLLVALREAGVDNMDVYEAVIRHPTTGFVSRDYVAVNVIGLISAADLGSSGVVGATKGNLLDTDFQGVAIDSSKAGDALFFRLAENINALMVHERVRVHLVDKGFTMLSLIPPEEWMG
jgi:hypothetical protein